VLLILLLIGYGAHDLYRSTWYILAALSGALLLQFQDGGLGRVQDGAQDRAQDAPLAARGAWAAPFARGPECAP
ncbi:MAG: hypothetical protein ACRD1E_07165, partial [Terriglobales bacterium]